MEGLMTIAFVAGILLVVCWIMVPFIIMGTNNRLDRIGKKMNQMDDRLKRIAGQEAHQEHPTNEPTPEISKEQIAREHEKNKKDTTVIVVAMAILALLAILFSLYGNT